MLTSVLFAGVCETVMVQYCPWATDLDVRITGRDGIGLAGIGIAAPIEDQLITELGGNGQVGNRLQRRRQELAILEDLREWLVRTRASAPRIRRDPPSWLGYISPDALPHAMSPSTRG